VTHDADTKRVRLRVRRGVAGEGVEAGLAGPARFDEWEVAVAPGETLLDALERARLDHDPSLAYREGCHHGSCGTCACRVDGVERLACLTTLDPARAEPVTVEPLAAFPWAGDLVVDPAPLIRDVDDGWSSLRACEGSAAKAPIEGVDVRLRLEDCIECGCCVSACPVTVAGERFVGPAALAALARQRHNVPGDAPALLARAAAPDGERRCRRAIACSRRCPTGVAPAKHIADLRRLVSGGSG
jgi:succinate dehydrogenase / fumarate reductase iron-sulfur subunit